MSGASPSSKRYLDELDGFVSIVTQRTDPDGTSGFSPYIGQELQLARRAQVPRPLFVDQRGPLQHHLEFPPDAVPYDPDEPGVSAQAHSAAIDQFRLMLEARLSTLAARPSPGTHVWCTASSGRCAAWPRTSPRCCGAGSSTSR